MKKKGLSLTTQGIILFSVLLMAANTLMGVALVNQSRAAMKTLIQERVLDVSNSIAAMVDGDVLGQLTAEDVGGPAYNSVMDILVVFRDHVDLQYVYCVGRNSDGEFIFTVDSAVGDAAAFGDPVVRTDALEKAWAGVASADDEPYRDAWGGFYSSYSPVFDSRGEVAGVVAVDFGADWFDRQVSAQTRTIIVGNILSLGVGVLMVLLFTNRLRGRLRNLNDAMHDLVADVESMSQQVQVPQRFSNLVDQRKTNPQESTDEIGELGAKIHRTQQELQAYVVYMKNQAFVDTLTGLGNHTAYREEVDRLTIQINANMAAFHVVMFDVNGLKTVNDNLGHEAGDQLLRDAAAILKEAFGEEHLFRIGGDEFVAVLENTSDEAIETMFRHMDEALVAFNQKERAYDIPLTISRGVAAFRRGVDHEYNTVFKRADQSMYQDKGEFYDKNSRA